MVEGVLLRHITGARADHHTELDFPVGLDRAFGQHHRIVGALNTASGLHEHNGFGGNRQAGLGRMVGVIQSNRDELADAGHRAAQTRRALDQRQLLGFEFAQPGQRRIAELVRANVLDHSAQVAQLAVGINLAWFFFSGFAVANKFHGFPFLFTQK